MWLGREWWGPRYLNYELGRGVEFFQILDTPIQAEVQKIPQDTGFYQYGAPPQTTRAVHSLSNEWFPNIKIGRWGPAAWPGGSPDLYELDNFLWGFGKD